LKIENPKISACIITDDNPEVINAIKSVLSSCFEVILVNTVETEKVKELIKDIPKVKYYYFKWVNDFSKARNYAIDRASGDWILTIDSDEVLEQKIEFVDDKYIAYQILQHNEAVKSITLSSRLFQNKPEIRYKNKVHESIDHLLTPFNVCKSDVVIKHSGYEISETEMEAKMNRNYKLMFEDYGNVIRNLHLGNYYFKIKQDYKTALDYYRDATRDKLNDEHYAIIWNNIHACYFMLSYPLNELLDALRKSLVYEPFQLYARVNIVEHLLSTTNENNKQENIFLIEKEIMKIQEIFENKLSKLIIHDLPITQEYINEKISELAELKKL
jgi:glycosyltransferase involved in cell wall biosynthesis